ncbi:uncharacterized protein [Rutidosis leptorrhynchoides]|uniref:uncharacterized protein isoform X1 n=1 Tax=Rutidosis leptorrhynchoides TaxID=125765 RepID=UPI003A9A1D36
MWGLFVGSKYCTVMTKKVKNVQVVAEIASAQMMAAEVVNVGGDSGCCHRRIFVWMILTQLIMYLSQKITLMLSYNFMFEFCRQVRRIFQPIFTGWEVIRRSCIV